MPTVLITGAAGFLGSHLVDKFTQNGDTVIALTHSERSTQLLKKKHPSIKIMKKFGLALQQIKAQSCI